MARSPFLNEVRASIRVRGMSIRTENTFIYWIHFFIQYNNCRHPSEMGATEVVASWATSPLNPMWQSTPSVLML
ncbi:phage integrase N-terminal SAM-like domain-containing protein [Vreelandella sedimenti]|jgi:hypothetical protein